MQIREASLHYNPTGKGEGHELARNHEASQTWFPGRSADRSWLLGSWYTEGGSKNHE